MSDDAQRTLLFPFESGEIDPPAAGDRLLCFNPAAGFRLSPAFPVSPAMVQPSRPDFLALAAAGFPVEPRAAGEAFDGALVRAGRHRQQNEGWIADAVRRVRPGGLVVVAGMKSDGAASLRKRLGSLVPLEGQASKYHGVVFWFRAPGGEASVRLAGTLAPEATVIAEGFRTAPGMFSHEHVDPGSRLLAENLPAMLGRRVADFGAGWGYLSAKVVEMCDGLSGIDLYEADFNALGAARTNVRAVEGVEIGFYWRDLLRENPERRYDAIVMNPPFHRARAADIGLGAGMIRAAAAALEPGGLLYMVANRQLPYEAVLADVFAQAAEIASGEGFKVIRARR